MAAAAGGGGKEIEAVIRIISQLEEEAGEIFFRAPGQKLLLLQERKRKEKWSNFGSEAHDFAQIER